MSIVRDIIFSYEDWWNGRIAFGGTIFFESDKEKEEIKSQLKFVNWSDLSTEAEKKIKAKQKEIFDELVADLLNKNQESFKVRYNESEEKKIFVNEILNDFNNLFYGYYPLTSNNLHHFSFLKYVFKTDEIIRIRNFINYQIIGGNRFYDFIQSPNQKLKCFENPPIEIIAQKLYNFFRLIKKQHQKIIVKEKQTILSLKVIALFYIYKNQQISRQNGNDIAKTYGHTSGEKLFQLYSKFSSRSNRIGSEDSKIKNNNKLKLFEKVVFLLNDTEEKQIAIDEMKTFQALLESEYH